METSLNNIENYINGCEHDMKVKAAQYVEKRRKQLNQDFYFAHPATLTVTLLVESKPSLSFRIPNPPGEMTTRRATSIWIETR